MNTLIVCVAVFIVIWFLAILRDGRTMRERREEQELLRRRAEDEERERLFRKEDY